MAMTTMDIHLHISNIFPTIIIIICAIFKGINGQNRVWINAHATYYGGNQNPSTLGGACGYDNSYHAGFGAYTAALSGALFRGGEACGACYQVICNGRLDRRWCRRRPATVTVTATNFCPSNHHGGWCDPPHHHFDMSSPAFFAIARGGNEGIVPVMYRRVPCKRRGGIRFTLKGRPDFNMIMIANVGGSGNVKNVWVRGSITKNWSPMLRNWGANWQTRFDVREQTLSLRITLGDGKTHDFLDVVPSSWKFGQTFASRDQFY